MVAEAPGEWTMPPAGIRPPRLQPATLCLGAREKRAFPGSSAQTGERLGGSWGYLFPQRLGRGEVAVGGLRQGSPVLIGGSPGSDQLVLRPLRSLVLKYPASGIRAVGIRDGK